jgi:hypothetical protein
MSSSRIEEVLCTAAGRAFFSVIFGNSVGRRFTPIAVVEATADAAFGITVFGRSNMPTTHHYT